MGRGNAGRQGAGAPGCHQGFEFGEKTFDLPREAREQGGEEDRKEDSGRSCGGGAKGGDAEATGCGLRFHGGVLTPSSWFVNHLFVSWRFFSEDWNVAALSGVATLAAVAGGGANHFSCERAMR